MTKINKLSVGDLIRAYSYKIRTYQVGSTGKISLHHLFNLFQDVAQHDAMKFGFGYPQMLKQERLWVLSRMSVELDSLPAYSDDVEILTWVKSVMGSRSEREFALVHKGKQIIRATSLWYCLSSKTHRPANIPMEDILQDLINDQYAVPGGPKKVNSEADDVVWDDINVLKAKYSDLDMVNHVNNASYVRWVMDEARNRFPQQLVAGFTINYLSEVHLGEQIEVKQKELPDGKLISEVISKDSGKVVCKTLTAWKS